MFVRSAIAAAVVVASCAAALSTELELGVPRNDINCGYTNSRDTWEVRNQEMVCGFYHFHGWPYRIVALFWDPKGKVAGGIKHTYYTDRNLRRKKREYDLLPPFINDTDGGKFITVLPPSFEYQSLELLTANFSRQDSRYYFIVHKVDPIRILIFQSIPKALLASEAIYFAEKTVDDILFELWGVPKSQQDDWANFNVLRRISDHAFNVTMPLFMEYLQGNPNIDKAKISALANSTIDEMLFQLDVDRNTRIFISTLASFYINDLWNAFTQLDDLKPGDWEIRY